MTSTDSPLQSRSFTIGGITFNRDLVLIIVYTTIIPMLDAYKHRIERLSASENRFLLYGLGTVLFIWLVWRETPNRYGLRLGKWREGVLWVLGVCLVMGAILYPLASSPALRSYYAAISADNPTAIIYRTGVEMLGWEFIWRGFALFGLARILGPGPAIWLQAVPFAYMHIGKPEIETLTTIFGGAGFGFVAWRTQSMLYGWLIHWFMLAFTMLVATGTL